MQQTPRNMGFARASLSSSLQSKPILQSELASTASITAPKSPPEVVRVSPKEAVERFGHGIPQIRIAPRPNRSLAGPTRITLDRGPEPSREFTEKGLVAVRMQYLRGMAEATALFEYGYKLCQLTSPEQSFTAPSLFADSAAKKTVLTQAIKRCYPQTTLVYRILSTFANANSPVMGRL